MVNLEQWMKVVNYRITEGSTYCWHCFGSNAYSLDSWNGDHDGHSHCITFDTKTQEVFMVEVFDYTNETAYRLINPAYKQAHDDEVRRRGADICAWESVPFIDLETDEDWIEKAQAIADGLPYDRRVSVPLDIPDEDLFKYMLLAHEKDVTFNQLVEEALRHAIDEMKADPEGFKQRASRWKEKINDAT